MECLFGLENLKIFKILKYAKTSKHPLTKAFEYGHYESKKKHSLITYIK